MINLGSNCGQQKAVSTKGVVDGAAVGEENSEGGEHLFLFGSDTSFYIYYGFLDYRLFSGNDYIVEGIIIQLSRPVY